MFCLAWFCCCLKLYYLRWMHKCSDSRNSRISQLVSSLKFWLFRLLLSILCSVCFVWCEFLLLCVTILLFYWLLQQWFSFSHVVNKKHKRYSGSSVNHVWGSQAYTSHTAAMHIMHIMLQCISHVVNKKQCESCVSLASMHISYCIVLLLFN